MDFLWVRWFRLDETHHGGFEAKRLHRLEFTSTNDDDHYAFGFLDPNCVMRASHLIPAFAHGRSSEPLPWTIPIEVSEPEETGPEDPEPDAEDQDEKYDEDDEGEQEPEEEDESKGWKYHYVDL